MTIFDMAGHLIRRLHQQSTYCFAQRTQAAGIDLTPVQYAVLRMLQDRPGIDQVTLAAAVALDTSTTADLAARLEAKGWIVRELLPRRQRALSLTSEGEAMLARLVPGLERMHAQLFDGLDAAEQAELMRLLRKFVHLNNDQSRAPLRG